IKKFLLFHHERYMPQKRPDGSLYIISFLLFHNILKPLGRMKNMGNACGVVSTKGVNWVKVRTGFGFGLSQKKAFDFQRAWSVTGPCIGSMGLLVRPWFHKQKKLNHENAGTRGNRTGSTGPGSN